LIKEQLLRVKVDDRVLAQASAILSGLDWIISVKADDGFLIVDEPKDSASLVNQVLAEHDIFASELITRNLSLESVFLQLTDGESDA
jgi:hypothetical protein